MKKPEMAAYARHNLEIRAAETLSISLYIFRKSGLTQDDRLRMATAMCVLGYQMPDDLLKTLLSSDAQNDESEAP